MVFFEWTKELSVGITSIDSQHKKFIEGLNEAYVKSEKESLVEQTERLSKLLEYARIHFTTEERIFDKYKYPYSNEHKLEHAKLIQETMKLYDDSKSNKKEAKELIYFLKNWLEKHLKKHDFKYAKYFKKNKIMVD
jgi:hemerythrin-like metal-binding protein